MASLKGEDVQRSLLTFGSVAGFVLLTYLARNYPRVGFAAWLVVLCFVPYWIGADVKVFFPAVTAAAIVLVIAWGSLETPRLSLIDWGFVGLIVAFVASALLGATTLASGFTLLATWGISYLLGRSILRRITLTWCGAAIAVMFTVVAVLAICEFVTGTNVFVSWHSSNSSYAIWGPLQYRGGQLRVEGAFGHSIALGASLAMAIPLVIGSALRLWLRCCMVTVMVMAAVLTFSRLGMICSVIGLVLSILLMRNDLTVRVKVVATSLVLAAVAAALPYANEFFESAGTEASGSADYRGDLLTLVGDMQIVGLSPAFAVSPRGQATFGGFKSIDSALVLIGLTYGLVPLAIVLVLLLGGVVLLLRGRATAPTIAIVAQIPALATVALITQYAVFLCFMAGLAVASQLNEAQKERSVLRSATPSRSARPLIRSH